jgi:hypothetical protein
MDEVEFVGSLDAQAIAWAEPDFQEVREDAVTDMLLPVDFFGLASCHILASRDRRVAAG